MSKKYLPVLISLMLVGCGSQQSVTEYVNQVKKNAKPKVDEIAPAQEMQKVAYNAGELRSPFKGSKIATFESDQIMQNGKVIVQKPRPDANRVREYLERYSIAEFIMVGTLSKKGITWGLVQDQTGIVHAVKIGDYIGENSGRVIGITSDQIDLLETVPDGEGDWMESNSYIEMQTYNE